MVSDRVPSARGVPAVSLPRGRPVAPSMTRPRVRGAEAASEVERADRVQGGQSVGRHGQVGAGVPVDAGAGLEDDRLDPHLLEGHGGGRPGDASSDDESLHGDNLSYDNRIVR